MKRWRPRTWAPPVLLQKHRSHSRCHCQHGNVQPGEPARRVSFFIGWPSQRVRHGRTPKRTRLRRERQSRCRAAWPVAKFKDPQGSKGQVSNHSTGEALSLIDVFVKDVERLAVLLRQGSNSVRFLDLQLNETLSSIAKTRET